MRSGRTARAIVAGLVVAVAAASLSSTARAQTPPDPQTPQPPTVAQAMARLQAQDPAGAATILEAVVAREPSNPQAWRLLGVARMQAEQFDTAITALERSLAIRPDDPAALMSLGGAHARKGNADEAFAWLQRANATGNADMTRLETDANVASLRTDPRFRRLMPTDAFFADPFVEPVTILREWRGEATNDQFGWIARRIGDVDGDAVPDVVTSAPTRANGGASAGRVYVYSTQTGKLLWTADGQPGDQLGIGIEAAGDTNGDGVPDVVASAVGRGEAYVYSGVDGVTLLTFRANGPNESFGRHVSGIGDIDDDGHADVVVGAPGRGPGSEDAGRAIVYSGRDGRELLVLTGAEPGDAFGSTVAGDAFGDGKLLVVGAPGAGPNGTGRGYVYRGLNPEPAFVIESDDTGAALGAMFASVTGDVDGDGVDDVYVSDWSNSAKGGSTGRVYVHSGADGRALHTFTGETAGEGLGTSPANVGDVDGDGHADILVGAWQYAGAAASGGRVYLFSGRDGALMQTYTSKIPGDTLGFDAVGLGDVDGDGMDDFLITAAWSGIRGFHSGRVFIISSGVRKVVGSAPPAFVVGDFEDDYGNRFTITPDLWTLHDSARYHVESWHPADRFVVLRNDKANPSEPGLWTRIDWVELEGSAPWRWAFCMSVYDAPSADAAAAATVADPATPRTGCNGYPFSRMKPVERPVA